MTEAAGPTAPTEQQSSPAVAAAGDDPIRFLQFLFQDYTTGYVEFRQLSEASRPKAVAVGRPLYLPLPLDYSIVTDKITSGGRQYVVGVAPRFRVPKRGAPGKDFDVVLVGCLWAEFDYAVEGGVIEVSRRLRDFPLRPTMSVNSAYGRQVYYVLDQPLSGGRLLEWDDLMRELRAAVGGEGAVHLARCIPLPSNPDPKGQGPRRPAALSQLDENDCSWVRYGFEELKAAISRARALGRVSSPGCGLGPGYTYELPATLQERGVAPEVIEAITTGRAPTRPGRPLFQHGGHRERDVWIAKSLVECGYGEEEIRVIFRSHPGGCGSDMAREKDGERYLEFTLRIAKALARRQRDGEEEQEGGEEFSELPDGYELGPDGSVWFRPPAADGERRRPKPVKVSDSYIGISAIQENVDSGHISLIIKYQYLGRPRRSTILRSQMADSRQLVSALADEGAPVTTNNARHVTSYLAAYEHAFGPYLPRRKVTNHFGRGRSNGPFFLPGLESDVEFAPLSEGHASLFRAYSSRRGTLRGWAEIGRTIAAEHLTVPQVSILTSFVPPLQSRLQIPNFILDIHGSTSTGKSTALKLAASVYGSFTGPDSLIMQWMSTQAAVEQLAGVCSELPIFLDDAQYCPDELKRAAVYMIANGRGKGRASRAGGVGEVSSWHTVALSTSEEPLHEASPHEGARGRILPVGGSVHPFPAGSGPLVQSLERSALLNHGYAGETYVRHLNNFDESEWAKLRRRHAEVRRDYLTGGASNVVDRVGGYIAAIQLAAEIACPLIGLPFDPEAVGTWLLLHLIEEQGRQNQVLMMLRALADFSIKHGSNFSGDERYDPARKVDLYGAVFPGRYVAFLRDTFDAVCRRHKWNPTASLNKLAEAHALVTTESDRHTKRVSVGRIKHRMICVKWPFLFPENFPPSDPVGYETPARVNDLTSPTL